MSDPQLEEHIKKKTNSQTDDDGDGGFFRWLGESNEAHLTATMSIGAALHLIGVVEVLLSEQGVAAMQFTVMGNTFLIFSVMYVLLIHHEEDDDQ